FEHGRIGLRQPLRPLVNREIDADAVARSVVEIEPGAPQGFARQSVELAAGRAAREDRAGDGDVALEHAGEAVAQLGVRPADADRAGYVGGAVVVLAAAV